MKKVILFLLALSVILISIISLKEYVYSDLEIKVTKIINKNNNNHFLKTFKNTNINESSILNTEIPDFVQVANKSINTVVHVRNSSTISNQFSIEDFLFGPTNDNQTYNAIIVGSDKQNDIALLKINSENKLPYATFGDSDSAQIGEWVLAVGNPFNLTSTVTAGIISAKSRSLDPTGRTTQSYIQTDAAVNPGNSGGALINRRGELIGINTAIQTQTGSYVGYSFAVPSNIAKKVIEDILEYGMVQYGFLGVTGTSLNSSMANELNIEDTEGFYINGIDNESGAKLAGISIGDIIKDIDGIKISKFSDLKGYLNTKRPDDIVVINIKRGNINKKIDVKLNKNERINFYLIGILRNMGEDDLKKRNLKQGVKISEFNNNYTSYWKEYGINEGDVIKKINGIEINSIKDIDEIIKSRNYYDTISIEILNSENQLERFNFR